MKHYNRFPQLLHYCTLFLFLLLIVVSFTFAASASAIPSINQQQPIEEGSTTNIDQSIQVNIAAYPSYYNQIATEEDEYGDEDDALTEQRSNYFVGQITNAALPNCTALRYAQYECNVPLIDNETYEATGCNKNNTVTVMCYVLDGVECVGPRNFTRDEPCTYTEGWRYFTALSLSVFLGILGMDRFYLGYVGIGLLKLFTLGLFGVGWILDVILIATQIVGPITGSGYVVGPYGPRFSRFVADNSTMLYLS